MGKIHAKVLAALFVFGIASAGGAVPVEQSPSAYVATAIEHLKVNHINRARLDWTRVANEARMKAASAGSREETYAIVRGVIDQLGEPHTFLLAPAASPAGQGSNPAALPRVDYRRHGTVGYLSLPTFAGSGDRARSFAQSIRSAIVELDQHRLCGWLIDLRWNEGGNMIPALLGLGSLVGEGRVGGVMGGPIPQYWHVVGDRALISDSTTIEGLEPDPKDTGASPIVRGVREVLSLSPTGPAVRQASLPLALMIGPHTRSAGEGIAVSLMGRRGVRSFGMPTAGRPTANIGIRLSDGAMLILTYGAFVDRSGQSFKDRVEPTVPIDYSPFEEAFSEESAVIRAATEWLQANCREPAARE